MSVPPIVPSVVKDRFDVYRFFNGLSAEGKDGLNLGRTRVPLVKTFLLEHVSSHTGREQKSPNAIFGSLGAEVHPIDENFFEVAVWQSKGADSKPEKLKTGYVEKYDERFFAYYTAEKADAANRRVKNWIASSPEIDSPWFSADFLQSLWKQDVSLRGDDRFGKLIFRHDSVFEMPTDAASVDGDNEESDADEDTASDDTEDRIEVDRRRIRSEMRDRIGPIRNVLESLQGTYAPLNALYGVRIPSSTARGGHDLYQEGRITNRSDSFEDHRNTARYLFRLYKSVLDLTEKSAWFAIDEAKPATQMRTSMEGGVPLIIRFAETLPRSTFDRWIELAFGKRNAFRLWGDPIRLGPTKVHVYGADRHLWQPINLEITADRLVAILPQGTCGNTFHRLVANVQRFVCPKIDVWLGARPFNELMSNMRASLAIEPSESGETPK